MAKKKAINKKFLLQTLRDELDSLKKMPESEERAKLITAIVKNMARIMYISGTGEDLDADLLLEEERYIKNPYFPKGHVFDLGAWQKKWGKKEDAEFIEGVKTKEIFAILSHLNKYVIPDPRLPLSFFEKHVKPDREIKEEEKEKC